MKDIEIAKETMFKEDLNFALVHKGEVLLTSKKRGIAPIYDLYNKTSQTFAGASISDRVIGQAAATLLIDVKIAKVFGELVSEKAIVLLEANNIEVSYDKKVKNILNRSQDDLCPMEKLSLDSPRADELNEKIRQFLEDK